MAQQIKPKEAKTLCDNYDDKYNELSKLIGTDDNRSGYLTLQELKDYIDYIENAGENIDGIRIYLGSNADTKLTTMFIAPTSQEKDNTTLDALNRITGGYPPKKKYTI